MFMQSVQGDAERWIAAVGVSRVHNTRTHTHKKKRFISPYQTDSRTDRAQTHRRTRGNKDIKSVWHVPVKAACVWFLSRTRGAAITRR